MYRFLFPASQIFLQVVFLYEKCLGEPKMGTYTLPYRLNGIHMMIWERSHLGSALLHSENRAVWMLYISAEIRIFILSLLPRHLFSNPMKDFSTKNAPLSQVVTFSPSPPAIHRYNESSPGQVFSETERFKELCVLSKENAWLSFFAMAHFLTMRRVPDKRFCVSSQNVASDPPEIPWVHKSSHKQRLAGFFSALTAQVRKRENLLGCNSWCTRSLLVPRRVDCSKWQV